MKKITDMINIMTQAECQMIHDSSMKILNEIGISIPNQEVLKMCEEVGAIVDYSREVITIPTVTMENFIEKVKKKSKYEIKERNKLNGSISTQVFLVDYMNKTRRYGLMDDIYKGIKLLDTLENFGGNGAIVVPSDVPYNFTDVKSFHAIYSYAKKQGGTFILSPTSAKYIVEMTKVMGRDVGYFLETISPLQYCKASLDMALVMTKMGMGISVGPMVIGGAIGPITIAGNTSLQNAEILGSMFVGYALTGQLNYGYGCYNHSFDIKTMLCSFGSPNQALLGMAAGQMGRYYGIYSVSNSGLTDSMTPDFQAGFQKSSSAIFSLLAGTSGVGGQGIVGADQGMSLEQLVIDNEWMANYNYIMSGFDVNESTIGFDTIKEVGIGGNYICEDHTIKYLRDSYRVSDFFTANTWETSKGVSTLDLAHEYVEKVTSGYKEMEPVVDSSTYEELTRILNEAEKELTVEREKK